MTGETLKRMWCAAEIASAWAAQTNIVLVSCDGHLTENKNGEKNGSWKRWDANDEKYKVRSWWLLNLLFVYVSIATISCLYRFFSVVCTIVQPVAEAMVSHRAWLIRFPACGRKNNNQPWPMQEHLRWFGGGLSMGVGVNVRAGQLLLNLYIAFISHCLPKAWHAQTQIHETWDIRGYIHRIR